MTAKQVNRWEDARKQARALPGAIQRVADAMEVDFPTGSPSVRMFLAEDFVTRWVMFGEALCGQ